MRLIDAGLLLNNLSGRLESMKDYDAVKDTINNMPTAYDVDKVVERLERCSQNIALIYPTDQGYDYEDGIGIDINKAKEIIKSGGIE